VIALVTVLAAGAALAVTLRAEKKYDATAQVLVTNTEPIDALFIASSNRSLDPERDINTNVALVTTEPVAARAIRQLGLHVSPNSLLQDIRAATAGTSNIISITARDPSPARARDIANAVARGYVAFQRQQEQEAYDKSASLATVQLARMTPEQRNGPQGKRLQAQLGQLENAAQLVTGGVQVAQTASVPTSPAVPRTKLTLAVAIILGLCVGCLMAIGLESVDRRLKDEADVEGVLDVPVLARVPAARRWRGPDDERAPQQEAYATVAVNLRLRDVDSSKTRAVMIASAEREAGKTAATIGVARALARAGQRVIAIEGDLRKPTFAEYLDLPSGGGLTAVLAGMRTLDDELVGLRIPPGSADAGDEAFFEVLPAGTAVADPHTVLPSERMREVLRETRERADIVLVDTPALRPVSDAVDLAAGVDRCVFVVRLKHTTKEDARRAVRALADVGVEVVGVIVAGAARAPSHASEYYSGGAGQARNAAQPRRWTTMFTGRRRRATLPSPE